MARFFLYFHPASNVKLHQSDLGALRHLVNSAAYCILGICLASVPTGAFASTVQFLMNGHIDVVYQVGPLPDGVRQGGSFTAILSFDPTTPDMLPGDPQRGYYQTGDAETNFLSLTAGQTTFRSRFPLFFLVGDDLDIPQGELQLGLLVFPDDSFGITTSVFEANFDNPLVSQMRLLWRDASRSALSSDALPRELSLADFSDPVIEISTGEIDPRIHQFTFRAIVQSVQRVPEPNTLALAVVCCASALWPLRRQ